MIKSIPEFLRCSACLCFFNASTRVRLQRDTNESQQAGRPPICTGLVLCFITTERSRQTQRSQDDVTRRSAGRGPPGSVGSERSRGAGPPSDTVTRVPSSSRRFRSSDGPAGQPSPMGARLGKPSEGLITAERCLKSSGSVPHLGTDPVHAN